MTVPTAEVAEFPLRRNEGPGQVTAPTAPVANEVDTGRTKAGTPVFTAPVAITVVVGMVLAGASVPALVVPVVTPVKATVIANRSVPTEQDPPKLTESTVVVAEFPVMPTEAPDPPPDDPNSIGKLMVSTASE
jgi:hypothetical protein